jgi:hypothetical protein
MKTWIPAFAGMTEKGQLPVDKFRTHRLKAEGRSVRRRQVVPLAGVHFTG